jgi:hypothetical protein
VPWMDGTTLHRRPQSYSSNIAERMADLLDRSSATRARYSVTLVHPTTARLFKTELGRGCSTTRAARCGVRTERGLLRCVVSFRPCPSPTLQAGYAARWRQAVFLPPERDAQSLAIPAGRHHRSCHTCLRCASDPCTWLGWPDGGMMLFRRRDEYR